MLLKIVTLPLSPFCRQLQKCFHKNALRPTDPFQTLVESVYNVVTARVISSNANKILPKQFLTQNMKGLLHPYQMMIQSSYSLHIHIRTGDMTKCKQIMTSFSAPKLLHNQSRLSIHTFTINKILFLPRDVTKQIQKGPTVKLG